MTGGRGQIKRVAYKIPRGTLKWHGFSHILDSIRKPDNKPWRKLLLQIFPTGLWAPTVHCVSNPHFFPSAASILYLPPRTAERARFDRSIGNMSRKQASVCRQGTWAVAPPSGKQKGGYQHIAWCIVVCWKDKQAKEFCKKEQEAWNRYVHMRSEKALSIAELTKGILTLKVVSRDCSRWLLIQTQKKKAMQNTQEHENARKCEISKFYNNPPVT